MSKSVYKFEKAVISEDLQKEFNEVIKKTGDSKSGVIRNSIREYVKKWR